MQVCVWSTTRFWIFVNYIRLKLGNLFLITLLQLYFKGFLKMFVLFGLFFTYLCLNTNSPITKYLEGGAMEPPCTVQTACSHLALSFRLRNSKEKYLNFLCCLHVEIILWYIACYKLKFLSLSILWFLETKIFHPQRASGWRCACIGHGEEAALHGFSVWPGSPCCLSTVHLPKLLNLSASS